MQIEINPYDNDQLKTRKVQANLAELGVLPADHNQRPTFLRSHRTAAILIDRALSHLAPDISVTRHCSNRQDFSKTANLKFAAAFEAIASGNFMNIVTNNAADGIYKINGSTVAITDIIDLALPGWVAFDPVQDIDAGGIKPRNGSGRIFPLTQAVVQEVVPTGFTIVYDFYAGADTIVDITTANDDQSEYGYQYARYRTQDGQDIIGLADILNGALAENISPAGIVPNADNKIAFVMTPDRIAASLNGGATVSLAAAGISANTTVIALGLGGDADARLHGFDLFEVVSNEDLSTLSAAA
jgi:hypothetical protein